MGVKNRLVIGSCTAREDNKPHKIIISQSIADYHKGQEHIAPKQLNLDNINGPEVFKTEDPDIFLLADGTILRKRGYISG